MTTNTPWPLRRHTAETLNDLSDLAGTSCNSTAKPPISAVHVRTEIAVRHLEWWSDRQPGGLCPEVATARQSCSSRCLLWSGVRDAGGINGCGGAVRAAAGQVVLHRGARAGPGFACVRV